MTPAAFYFALVFASHWYVNGPFFSMEKCLEARKEVIRAVREHKDPKVQRTYVHVCEGR